ncbi:MAG TPA: response regulator transcription factor [Rhizomicrobium sp.]|jgi:two-component system copper resistance phosphate regulon response regulator CusR|nr:response regulator transcription factor [Rhizomicrobium sp.]
MRILIVEDEKKFLDILLRSLKSEGYMVDGVGTAADAVDYLKSYHYDLVVLDLQLPDGTGNSLIRRLRESGHTMPVLVLTARSELESKVENFQAGADDYVVKPVAMAELAIRVQALLRRGPVLQENVLKARDLEINRLTRQVKRGGKRIELSPKEYSLLEYLFLHPGRVLSRSMIVEKIWDESFEGLTNIVDVYIGHLRRKVDEGHSQKLIRTVRGLGYMLDTDRAQ